jgi:putative N-acetylmannosamine-6-phosphate epimerase
MRSSSFRRDPRVKPGEESTLLNQLRGGVIVSCQMAPGGPMDAETFVVGFALAARDGGARGLRIQGARNVAAAAAACDLPIIGLIKRDLPDSPVRITTSLEDVHALADAGAPIIAFDATLRPRPVAVPEQIAAVHARGRLAMADCADIADMRAALAAGADILASTMSGYTRGAVPKEPDLALVRAGAALAAPLFAEGRYNTPALAAAAIEAGAYAVVVGTAITRPETITAWYAAAIAGARQKEEGETT